VARVIPVTKEVGREIGYAGLAIIVMVLTNVKI
jgi:hypothetical protein